MPDRLSEGMPEEKSKRRGKTSKKKIKIPSTLLAGRLLGLLCVTCRAHEGNQALGRKTNKIKTRKDTKKMCFPAMPALIRLARQNAELHITLVTTWPQPRKRTRRR